MVGLGLAQIPPPTRFAELVLGPFVVEFLLGAAVGWCVKPEWNRRAPALLAAAGVWFAAAFGLTYSEPALPYKGDYWLLVAVWAVPSALTLAALAAADLGGRWRMPRRLQQVGEASYSIYLVHMLTIAVVFRAWCELDLGHRRFGHLMWVAVTLTTAVGAGLLVHHYVEKPLLTVLGRGDRGRKGRGEIVEMRRVWSHGSPRFADSLGRNPSARPR